LFEGDIAGAANLEQRIARHRLEGLDAPAQQDRQAAKFARVEGGLLPGEHYRDDFGGKKGDPTPGQELEGPFHILVCLRTANLR
jgi:hypothetical protein